MQQASAVTPAPAEAPEPVRHSRRLTYSQSVFFFPSVDDSEKRGIFAHLLYCNCCNFNCKYSVNYHSVDTLRVLPAGCFAVRKYGLMKSH